MTFDLFVIPFFGGLIFLLVVLFIKYSRWIALIDRSGRRKIGYGLFSLQIFPATWEVFLESLLHRRMWKQNKLLGYMHMSFAFGWLLLILLGNLESRIYSGGHLNPPYYPIFLKFFVHDKRVLPFELNTLPGFFRFIMDFVLLYILSGLVLAFFKRIHSRWFGMKNTSRHNRFDQWAITCLWLIFPLRLLAESLTASIYGGGGFLTNSVGDTLAMILPAAVTPGMAYVAWWAYSSALGIFFITLPWSRYMHIPTEVVMIYLKHFGVKSGKHLNSFSEIEMRACPKCGVCIDVCQMKDAGAVGSTPAYFVRSLRMKEGNSLLNNNCMLCGRCKEVCPVQIDLLDLRIASRNLENQSIDKPFSYLPADVPDSKGINVLYFAGCMGHLTPSVKKAMVSIMDAANVKYKFLDQDGSVCCGRPLMMAGMFEAARSLMEKNRQAIHASGARILVTSCPICYKIFNEEYKLFGVEVLHHSQYLLRLVEAGSLWINHSGLSVVYHDPCELGRGSEVYKEPRKLLKRVAKLIPIEQERENALCCGGSIGDLALNQDQRNIIRDAALDVLLEPKPDFLVTACPLCKKTFSSAGTAKVIDIAELVAQQLEKADNLIEETVEESIL
ncbi:MAG: (Fe-S)-binding protein [Bacteroidales bacterium]|nr:(Fe-S)-binding protein [Bacteroidales bacterium]